MPRAENFGAKLPSLIDSFFFMVLCLLLPVLPWFYGLTQARDQFIAETLVFFLFLLSFLSNPRRIVSSHRTLDRWVLFSAGLAFMYVLISILPYRSSVIFIKYFSIVVFYFFARRHINSFARLRILLWVFLACGIFYSVIGLLQWHGYLKKDFWYGPASLASRYINGGHFANFLFFSFFSALILMLTSSRTWVQAGIAAAILIILWAFLLTRTRSAWLGFAFGMGIFFWLSDFKSFLKPRKRALTVSALITFGGVLFLIKGGPVLAARFQEIWDGTNPRFYSLIFRANTVLDSVHAILARPWGWGTGTFVEVMPQYRGVIDRFLLNYAHNEFLQVGVDLGLPGFVFLAAFIFFYFRKALFFLKKTGTSFFERCAGASFLAAAAALTFTSQADFPLRIFANSLMFAVFLAASALIFGSGEGETGPPSRPLRIPFRIAVAGVVFFSGILSGAFAYAQVRFEKAEYFNQYLKWPQAEEEYKKALAANPMEPLYLGRLAWLFERRMAVSRDAEQIRNYRKQAIRLYEEAIPHTRGIDYYDWLARLYESENRITEAQALLKKALQWAPRNGFILSEYGYFALRHLPPQEAVPVFEQCQSVLFKGTGKCDCSSIMKEAAPKIQRYEDLKRMIGTQPEDHACLGETLGRLGQWDLAKKELDEALEGAYQKNGYERFAIYTRNPILEFYRTQGRTAEMLEIYRRSLALQPGDAEVRQKILDLETELKAGMT